MIELNGQKHYTIADAAGKFGVTPKAVRDWIIRGIIPRPKSVTQGLRRIQVFPSEYMQRAKAGVKEHRRKKSAATKQTVAK